MNRVVQIAFLWIVLMATVRSQGPPLPGGAPGGPAQVPPLPQVPALPSLPGSTVPPTTPAAVPPAETPAVPVPGAPAAAPATPVDPGSDVPNLPILPGAGEAISNSDKAAIKQELIELMGMTNQLQKRIAALTSRLEGGVPQVNPAPSRPLALEPGEPAPGDPLPLIPNVPGGAPAEGETPAGGPAGAPKTEPQLYPVSKFKIAYAYPNPKLPPVEELEELKVTLGPQEDGLGAPRTGKAAKRNLNSTIYKLEGEKVYTPAGLQIVIDVLQKEMNRRGFVGVNVQPAPEDLNPNFEDLRAGRKPLKLVIYTSTIRQLRTVSKQVKPGQNAVDTEPLKWVAKDSPLQPGDLLRKPDLDNYLTGLNRAPGRRIDAAINASGDPGGIVLDYIVREEKPFSVYTQASNTGTESTGEWRFRLGLEYRDLFGHGDIINGDVISSIDGESVSVLGSYIYPLILPTKLRAKIYGSYGRFTASDVGFDLQNFKGDTVTGGLSLIWNPINIAGAPLDIFIGAEYRRVSVENSTFPQEGESQFFVPYAGFSVAKATDRYSFSVSAQAERNLPHVAGTKREDLARLGRFDPDPDATVFKWGVSTSVYLEPLVFGAKWGKEDSPWWKSTLGHEFAFSAHGQYTLGNSRLIPQFEDVVGGLTSVRGYPEAITAGDTTFVGSAEYRIHVPKLFKPRDRDKKLEDQPPKFALRPNTVGSAFGRADWDLIVRGFVDGALTYNNDKIPSAEEDEKLLSAGIGLELQILRYMNVRVDYGVALLDETDFLVNPVHSGDGRFHFLFSLYW